MRKKIRKRRGIYEHEWEEPQKVTTKSRFMEYLLLKPIDSEESLPIGSVITITDGWCKLDNGWSIPVQWFCDHGYLKEIPEEPIKVPERINEAYSYFQGDDRNCMGGPNGREAFVAAILKHYPKKEELPIEDIAKRIKKAVCKHCGKMKKYTF